VNPSLSIVPSMYSLMCAAELVTPGWGLKTENPHLDATRMTCQLPYDVFITEVANDYQRLCRGRCAS
jgi:hypothetical protein